MGIRAPYVFFCAFAVLNLFEVPCPVAAHPFDDVGGGHFPCISRWNADFCSSAVFSRRNNLKLW
jgi:hypothetical protein